MKKLVIASLILGTHFLCLYPRTTIQVAELLGYPKLIYRLRADAQEELAELGIEMNLDVQELRAKDLMNRAEGLEYKEKGGILAAEERMDREFERIDRKLTAGANRLDDEDAPYEKKAAFIYDVMDDAEASIRSLLNRYRRS